jgi:hypothetical protein
MVFSQATTLIPVRHGVDDAIGGGGVGLEHADARAIGNDLDFGIGDAKIVLQILRVVERQVPLSPDRGR